HGALHDKEGAFSLHERNKSLVQYPGLALKQPHFHVDARFLEHLYASAVDNRVWVLHCYNDLSQTRLDDAIHAGGCFPRMTAWFQIEDQHASASTLPCFFQRNDLRMSLSRPAVV